jgi:hypothetical protein
MINYLLNFDLIIISKVQSKSRGIKIRVRADKTG